jgi:hypothetical protein
MLKFNGFKSWVLHQISIPIRSLWYTQKSSAEEDLMKVLLLMGDNIKESVEPERHMSTSS